MPDVDTDCDYAATQDVNMVRDSRSTASHHLADPESAMGHLRRFGTSTPIAHTWRHCRRNPKKQTDDRRASAAGGSAAVAGVVTSAVVLLTMPIALTKWARDRVRATGSSTASETQRCEPRRSFQQSRNQFGKSPRQCDGLAQALEE